MNRLSLALAALAALLVVASSASAASAATDRCRPKPGEQALARSAEAVVLQKIVKRSQRFPLQTITGCSRRSGKRRVLEVLQRRTADDETKLLGVKLAGTRVAYAMVREVEGAQTALIADDAVHGGRRHDLSIGGWPFGTGISFTWHVEWAVDAQGDVAWITTDSQPSGKSAPSQALGVWRAGLGRRQVESHAALSRVTLRDGVLRWLRGGTPRVVELASVPATRCSGKKATVGTLDVDVVGLGDGGILTACARATGKTASADLEFAAIADANGPYVLVAWAHVENYVTIFNLVDGTTETIRDVGMDATIDERGSLAWVGDGLWVRDAAGTRKVAESPQDLNVIEGPLQREGSTVTWPGTGVTVTLNP